MNKRTNTEILADLQQVECELSPENLHCDGEISASAANKKFKKLKAKQKQLIEELGREPTDQELYPR